MKLIKIIECLENWAPPILQEEYDNSGLIIGNPNNEIKGILVTLDCTEEIFDQLGVGIVTYEGNLVNEIVGLCHYHYVEIVNDVGEGI